MIFDRMLRASVSWEPLDDRWYTDLAGGGSTLAGFYVTPDTAARVSAVFACVSVIAETVGGLPFDLLRRLDDGGTEKARDHRVYKMLRRRVNERQGPMDFLSSEQFKLGLRGGSFSEIRDDGERMFLRPMHPKNVTVEELPNGRLRYKEKDPKTGEERVFLQDQVLQVRDLTDDGVNGMARSALAKEAIAVSAAAEGFVGAFFRNDATGRLVLNHGPNMGGTKELRDEKRRQWQEANAGWRNNGKTLHLWGGMEVKEVGNHDDGSFIVDPRKFQVADVGRFWRVPLWMIGLEEKSSSWGSGVEQQFLGFVNLTIKAWADRWAQAMNLALLDESEQEEFFIAPNFKDLVRGDIKTRAEAYEKFRNMGVLNANEIREREDMNRRDDPGGDDYAEAMPGSPTPNASAETPKPKPAEDAQERGPHPLLVADAAQRIASAESKPSRGHAPDKIDAQRRSYVLKVVTPLAASVNAPSWLADAATDRIVRGEPGPEREAQIAAILTETLHAGATLSRAA